MNSRLQETHREHQQGGNSDNAKIADMKTEIEALVEEFKMVWNNDSKKFQETVSSLREEKAKAEREVMALRAHISKCYSTIKRQKADIAKIERDRHQEAEQMRSVADLAEKERKTQFEKLEKEYSDLRLKLEDVEVQHSAAAEEWKVTRDGLNKEIERIRKHSSSTIWSLLDEVTKIKTERDAREREATLAKKQHANLKDSFEKWSSDNEAELESFKAQVEELVQELEETQAELEGTVNETDSMKEKHAQDMKEISERMERVKKQNKELEDILARYTDRNVQLMDELAEARDDSESAYTHFDETIEQMKEDFCKWKAEQEKNARAEIDKQAERVSQLIKENEMLEAKLRDERALRDSSTEALAREKTLTNDLRHQISAIEEICETREAYAEKIIKKAEAQQKLIENFGIEEIDDLEEEEEEVKPEEPLFCYENDDRSETPNHWELVRNETPNHWESVSSEEPNW